MPAIQLNCGDLLTAKEVQSILRIGKTLLYELLSRGEIKSVKIGKTIKIPKIYLEGYLNSLVVA